MGEPREITELFRLEKVLKSSLSGVVFRATEPESGTRVAIKLINRGSSPDQAGCARRFGDAAEEIKKLAPPAFPAVLDEGITPDGTAFLVLEYLEATSLESLAGQPPDLVVRLLGDVATSLAVLAEAGVVHHNICPENLLVVATPSGRAIKVVGFGSAAFRPEGLGISQPSGSACLAFAAPELVATGSEAADWRADLYSFSLVVCQLLGAQVVVGAGGEQSVVPPPSLHAGLPRLERLVATLQSCLRLDAGARPASFDELRAALAAAATAPAGSPAESRGVASPSPTTIAPPPVLREPPPVTEQPAAPTEPAATPEEKGFETQVVSRERVAQTLAMSVREIKEAPGGPPSASAPIEPGAAAPSPAQDREAVITPMEPPGGPADEGVSASPEEEKRTMRIDLAEIRATPTPPPPPPGAPDAGTPSSASRSKPPFVPPPTSPEQIRGEPAGAAPAAPAAVRGEPEARTLENETVLIPQVEMPEVRADAAPATAASQSEPTVARPEAAEPGSDSGAGETVQISHLAMPEPPPPVPVTPAPPSPSQPAEEPVVPPAMPPVAPPPPVTPAPPPVAATAARPVPVQHRAARRPWLLVAVVLAVLALLAVTIGVIVARTGQTQTPVAALPTRAPTPRPAATPVPTAVPTAVKSLEEAEKALAANDLRGARAAADSISADDEKLLTAAEADRLATVRDALGEKRRSRLAANLARGLSSGNIDLLRRTIAELSADDVHDLSSSRRDEERLKRARQAVDLNTAVQNAFRDRQYLEAVKRATALLAIVPKASQAADVRERSAKVLDAEADAAVKNGDFEGGLKGYTSLREAWPDRPGIALRIEEVHAAQKADAESAATLAAIARTGEEGHPEKGLAMLKAAKPEGRWAARFAQAKERLEHQLAELDRQPPVVQLKPGYKPEYEKNKPAAILLRVTDDHGVKSVSAMGRREDTKQYSALVVKAIGGGDYEIEVPASFHGNDTVEFYVVAADESGHTTSLGTPEAPLKLKRKHWLF
jgi:serine/threonine protein kinase